MSKELPDLPSGLILALDEAEEVKEDKSVDDRLNDVASDLIEAVQSGNKEQVLDALKLFKELS